LAPLPLSSSTLAPLPPSFSGGMWSSEVS
jgi:hypothetical protein